ncbi:MAG: hypothetical protein WC061_03105, partial [Melioribacteraceae bacterium]
TYFKTVTVETDKATRVFVNIEQETMGFIYCLVSPPVGEIFINGNKKADLPMMKNDLIKVTPGWIQLVIKNPKYEKIDTLISVRAKDTLNLKFRLKNE